MRNPRFVAEVDGALFPLRVGSAYCPWRFITSRRAIKATKPGDNLLKVAVKTAWAWLCSPQATRLEIALAQGAAFGIYEAIKHG